MIRPIPFAIDNDRFYYEPRALWSTGRVGPAVQTRTQFQGTGYQPLPKEHYRNGSRWPIRITHAIVSPVGYLFRSVTAGPVGQYDSAMAGIGRMKLRIAFPKSSWIERLDADVMDFATEPAAEPSFAGDAALEYSSGLFGLSRWTFEPSYIVPRKVTLDLILSTIQGYTPSGAGVGTAAAIFHERGGRMLGHARSRPEAALAYGPSYVAGDPAWPDTNVPVVGDVYADAFGLGGQQGQTFPGNQKWPSNLYLHQLGSRGLPYTEVTGFAVAIDQIDIDDDVHAAMGGFGGATNGLLAPVSQRIITKAQTRDGGTQERWWRDGAPLSLVTPTLNNAGFVHRFGDAFILGPGEGLEVGLQSPITRQIGETALSAVYNVGVSFLGYACVEDNNQKVYR